MAAVAQPFSPSTSTTITMLQARPASASNAQPGHHFASNPMNRNNYHGINAHPGQVTYRGQTSTSQNIPYTLTNGTTTFPGNIPRTHPPFMNKDQRTTSAPITPTADSLGKLRYPAPPSVSTVSSSSSSELSTALKTAGTRDDSAITTPASTDMAFDRGQRPQSQIISSVMDLALADSPKSMHKPQPERYRRTGKRRTGSSGGGTTTTSPPTSTPASPSRDAVSTDSPVVTSYVASSFQVPNFNAEFQVPAPQFYSQNTITRSSVEDINVSSRPQPAREDSASRYRRRSIHTSDLGRLNGSTGDVGAQQGLQQGSAFNSADQQAQHPLRSYPTTSAPASLSPALSAGVEDGYLSKTQYRQGVSTASAPGAPTISGPNPVASAQLAPSLASSSQRARPVDNSIRKVSNPDASRRVASASPLSKPMTMGPNAPATKDSFASAVSAAIRTSPNQVVETSSSTAPRLDSTASKTLTALGTKDEKKSKGNRLRRAFSFGSAAELRKASAGVSPPVANAIANEASLSADERARLRKERYHDEREAEQARIAARQEAGGIGAGIYSGQGNFFSGSTDNLSISSTASSASIMLRKMGKGMKKSTRSLVGLFRPKSVIGVPAADGPLQDFSQAQVSMVTVEAERERVNVNVNPHDQVGGGTGFPKLERNSVDMGSAAGIHKDSTCQRSPRRSITGGEAARAEVLAAVKKGILKRAQTDSPINSPSIRPLDGKSAHLGLPNTHNTNESPRGSAPNTPGSDQGHRRGGSVVMNDEDYFMSALRTRGESKSSPVTPMGHIKRNATFSPRIQFHDTWPSGEYDRRGEIATCNRLTPMLAQQIKEELNNFKMEMEVHENSKIYTHFF